MMHANLAIPAHGSIDFQSLGALVHRLDRVSERVRAVEVHGLLEGLPPDEAVRLGWAHGALVTTFPGDTTMATLEQVRSLARGGSARIPR